ncbi:hypothetical protein H8356DRAFT_948207 [Neocallimastix lanati (nom. inval.)]|jgi:hypothetical protein|uniref:Coth-domain-containing protein n=1 Tax=Neocallimastix californiae TaxID=1754190 RepID=A0A1Y2D698_9FUNG|nr:hypothetical protein H8356DRAFT_948207 [Neocallimastix sp. JGI-2020a]ORY54802.1 hypothetical protein LY90DRAFT_702206 [Neocallimastix californiae]|eukprot:ORY54802.1 hypothetical protein LY90DRAFT_702206 [Neocallimastix californiae]
MFKKIIILTTLSVSAVFTRNVNFKVISFGNSTEVQIVGGQKFSLLPVNEDPIFFKGQISNVTNSSFNYYYIVDGEKEKFVRTFDGKANSTLNDFYGRKDTIKTLKTFQHPPSLSTWDRSIGKAELFDDSYIPTIHFTGNNVTENFFHHPGTKEPDLLEKVTIYLKDSVKIFTDVPATAKNMETSKFQIRFKLGYKGIDGRYRLKLRNSGEDPLNLRQFIYGNMIQAIGMPSIHSVMARVYYNKKPVGFYVLQEEAYSESFIRAEFYGDPHTGKIDTTQTLGNPINGEAGSDFEYKPDNMEFYENFEGNKTRLLPFCKAINDLNPKMATQVKVFEKRWFDIDTFHKAMAIEYLTGDWDGYWYTESNFAIYDDPSESTNSTYRYYFITQDHDETFGVGLCEPINSVGYNFTQLSYTTMVNRTWEYLKGDKKNRVLVEKLIGGSKSLQKRFQETLLAIVKTIFNPVVFREVVESYRLRFTPEMEWDYSFIRPYNAGVVEGMPIYNYRHFLRNFEEGVGGLHWGLYRWVEERADAIKKEFCITWPGDHNPPSADCKPKKYF